MKEKEEAKFSPGLYTEHLPFLGSYPNNGFRYWVVVVKSIGVDLLKLLLIL